MEIEYEARFMNIDKDDMRKRLLHAGGLLIRSEFLQKRVVFDMPSDKKIDHRWIRVRDEGDKTTVTLKIVDGKNIENQKEINLAVDDFEKAVELLGAVGCKKIGYQENRRELWMIEDVQITIDEWPFLNPFIEIEGPSEIIVKTMGEQLGFVYQDAVFGGVGAAYMKHYNVPYEIVEKNIEYATFEIANPFIRDKII